MGEPLHDETFGRLEWDAVLKCWLGGIDWPPGLYTEVAIWLPNGDLAAGLHQARESLNWLRGHEEQARLAVAAEMVKVYNDAWRDEDEPITAAEFAGRTELARIGFEDDGSLLLSYDGRDMFGGHVIDGVFDADRSFSGGKLIG
ncbi:DUF2262 domain-containing protein [Limnoglobus roseus]|uniref:DUF2262 domain-containing protein n=1 Tax=Limnoglobus roseus TaxID=2598579 RepID=A0A5C1A4W0_9BACT|nr:DUF2262 domain-containing protein [Limnoglobus roseus]QEL14141.1 hypothetical protein PX52LOC_01011 [Limnoglobus roseus]